jgi:hypothetical protein
MNKIVVNRENKVPLHPMHQLYKYEFENQFFYLETDAKEPHYLEDYLGYDVRDNVFEMLLKDFIMTLRKSIYKDDVEKMLGMEIKELIKTKNQKPWKKKKV